MRRIAVASLVFGVFAAGCGGASPTQPGAGSATGASRVMVPKLVGKPWVTAQSELGAHHLRMRTSALSNLCAGVAGGGSIMLQDPRPGTRVGRGSAVTVQTSCHGGASRPGPCQAQRLRLSQSVGAGLGTTYLDLRLRNAALRSCELGRSIRARLLGTGQAPLLKTGQNDSAVHGVVIGSGQSALVTIGWSNWCRGGRGPFRAQLVLPTGGGRLASRPWGPASCTSRSSHSTLFIASMTIDGRGA
jgi:hypothetical protein